jgi:peptide chain release factor 2
MYTWCGAKIRLQNQRTELERRSCRYKTNTRIWRRLFFGYLKGENGVHRLVRISPTVMPSVIPLCIRLCVSASRWQYRNWHQSCWYRDYDFPISGAGGQNVNRKLKFNCFINQPEYKYNVLKHVRNKITDSVPCKCYDQLYEIELKKKKQAQRWYRSGKMKIEWGSQIRNYVMQPYKLVKT